MEKTSKKKRKVPTAPRKNESQEEFEKRKKYARILNKHYLTNGYGHQLFKELAVTESNNPKKEKKNGESE